MFLELTNKLSSQTILHDITDPRIHVVPTQLEQTGRPELVRTMNWVSYCLVNYHSNLKSFNPVLITVWTDCLGNVALLIPSASILNFIASIKNVIVLLVTLSCLTEKQKFLFCSWLPGSSFDSSITFSSFINFSYCQCLRNNKCFLDWFSRSFWCWFEKDYCRNNS